VDGEPAGFPAYAPGPSAAGNAGAALA